MDDSKESMNSDYESKIESAVLEIAELQRIWRKWLFGGADSDASLMAFGVRRTDISREIWEHDPATAKSLTYSLARTLPYIYAMVSAIEQLRREPPGQRESRVHRALMFHAYLPESCRTTPQGAVPHAGSSLPDIFRHLAGGFAGSPDLNSLPELH